MVRRYWRLRCPEGHTLSKVGHEAAWCNSCWQTYALDECEDVTPDPHEETTASHIGHIWTPDRGFVRV